MRRLNCLVLAILVLLGLGCGEDEPAFQVNLAKRVETSVSVPKRAVTYAYLPQFAHTVSYERHRLLVEYLQKATGLPIRQIFPDTFDEHVKMMERGEIDISFSNPFVYIRMASAGARAFARIIEPTGAPEFYSQIIVRKDNRNIEKIEDCRGKRWLAVDPSSAGGYIYALGEFFDHGIRREDFAEIAFAPGPGAKQEKVIMAVYAGAYDLGSVRDGALPLLKDKIDLSQIRVLTESKRYPGWVYASRPGLDPDVVRKVSQAMFALSMERLEDALILRTAGMRGIIPAVDADYAPVRELAGKLGLETLEAIR